jgi:hypothetical protein
MAAQAKRSIIINEYEEGGLKMPNIQSFYKALKMSWLHKLLDPFNHSPWKVLLLGYIQKWGGLQKRHHFHNIFCSYTYCHLFLSKDLTIWAGSRVLNIHQLLLFLFQL